MSIKGEIKNHFNNIFYKMEVKKLLAKEKIKDIKKDNRGIAVIEIILILVIVLGLIIIFRKNLQEMIKEIFDKIKGNKDTILEPMN